MGNSDTLDTDAEMVPSCINEYFRVPITRVTIPTQGLGAFLWRTPLCITSRLSRSEVLMRIKRPQSPSVRRLAVHPIEKERMRFDNLALIYAPFLVNDEWCVLWARISMQMARNAYGLDMCPLFTVRHDHIACAYFLPMLVLLCTPPVKHYSLTRKKENTSAVKNGHEYYPIRALFPWWIDISPKIGPILKYIS